MWPGTFLPRWVACFRNNTDPTGFTFEVDPNHVGYGNRDQRWRCQRAHAHELPCVLVPPEQLGH
eukprot:5096188-Lingulodinium_polyedra.AAC.1